jgi:hypothetical protein
MVVAGLWKKGQGAVSMNETLCHVCHCCVVLWWESKGFLAAEFSRVAKDAYVHQWSFLVWFMQFHDRNRMVELLVCGFVFYRF